MKLAISPLAMILLAYLMITVTYAKEEVLDIRMPGASPNHQDTYLCGMVTKIPAGNQYIVNFEPEADMDVVHHMFLHGCGEPTQKTGLWDCQMARACSGGKSTTLYAWGRNAGPLKMPPDTGMHVGGSSGYNYFVLQLHYLHVKQFKNGHTDHSGVKITLDNSKKNQLAGIYVVAHADTWSWSIPPHNPKYHMNAGCGYPSYSDGPTFHAFRFRVHTHSLGTVVTGYRVRRGKWTLIGRGDPQEPQAFNPTTSVLDIQPGDKLMMRCTYNSMSRNRITYIGATHHDEMCNFYVMYYYDASKYGEVESVPCESDLVRHMKYPNDSDVPKMSANPSAVLP